MAIKPETIRATDNRSISDEEETLLEEVEAEIDLYLQTNFANDDVVSFILETDLTMVAKRELLRRYREAGWRVLAFKEAKGSLTTLHFAEGSASVLQPAERPSKAVH